MFASTCSAGRTAGAAPSLGEPVPTASATEIAAARLAAAAGALVGASRIAVTTARCGRGRVGQDRRRHRPRRRISGARIRYR
jgi:hypothetical protein